MSFTVSIDGDEEFRKLLHSTGMRLEQALKGAVAETALDVERDAKRSAPVDTGRLRSSIGVEFIDGGLAADVTASAEYAVWVEQGHNVPGSTKRIPPRPFLTPAAERARARFRGVVESHARRALGGS